MKKEISIVDKMSILMCTLIKLIRGLIYMPFFKRKSFPLFIGKNTTISHKHMISLGKKVKFEKNCEVQGLSKQGIVFGESVTIGHTCMIRPSSYYGVEIGEGLIIGDNSSIGPFSYIGCAGLIQIGNNVMIGPRVSLFAENHVFANTNETIKSQGVVRSGITIEDDCWIGSGVIILDGVTIGKGSVIGAGTLISKDVPPNSIVIDKRQKVRKER